MENKELKNGLSNATYHNMGPVMQKIILLLAGGVALGLSKRPDVSFRMIKGIANEWNEINKRSLYKGVRKLYSSRMLDFKKNKDGIITLFLTDKGKKKALCFDIEKIQIKKPKVWDGVWRMVIFDVPENLKRGRNALAVKLKKLGFFPVQKSVFIYPYECRDEIDFIVEVFDLRPYVRFIVVKEIDTERELKKHFGL